VLFVGRLEARKKPETLIEAARQVLAAIPSVRFRFVGSDTLGADGTSQQQNLERHARQLGVRDALEFIGPLDHDDVFDEMAQAAVCAFPSSWESFGLVAAEAASIGRPVVVSDIPAFRDYVEDRVSGRIAAVGDPGAWSSALIEMLQAPERSAEMGSRLRTVIAKRAAPDVVARQTIEAYTAAIAHWRVQSRGKSIV
jgi:1,4-alpha-glucan branching enzyme